MRRSWMVVCLVFPVGLLAQNYDTALAPYPLIKESFAPEVEGLLARVRANAPAGGAFLATVTWTCESSRKLKLDRQNFGPFSLKSCPNWHSPPDRGYWKEGAYTITAQGGNFRIDKPEDEASSADWWQKDGEHTYSRAWSEDWPTVWRFHHDAFEAGMLGYPEGLGLLLWAFNPGEYLRRADHLEVGEDRKLNGKVCKTLVATPAWIQKPLFLENRGHYPFNESTLLAWAPLRPVVTYFIDPHTNVIVEAELIYHKMLRSGPKDWKAASKPSGLEITCLAQEMAQTASGTWYPTRIAGEVAEKGEVVRRTLLAVTLSETEPQVPALELPEGKRAIDPWPPYRSAHYQALQAAGDETHATRVGLVQALAFEGRVEEAEQAFLAAVTALELDKTLVAETFAGIDWELGFALYELFRRYDAGEIAAFRDAVPRSRTWLDIVERAVDLYARYRGADIGGVEALRAASERLHERIRQADDDTRHLRNYVAELRRRALKARTDGGRVRAEKLAAEVESRLAQ